ncbi:Ig-like domain-containing protein [Solirubrobacter soli]|uniref:Ig-like domain-containing protein n=1 Tax=Solirubrobacter soli TaxID=363832 RepID=UPI000422831B|nr:Ig-like domain-containing protein [Solirubrobacter soli]
MAPAAHAAQLTVDDDRGDCPAAQFTSVQAAIDAAAPGDTIAICPGTYREGTGAVASNALTISKSVTLKGAGADLVSIRPKVSGAGQIAEASQDIRNGVGDIVSVRGGAALPITVDISGVTVDGAGAVVEAGVVYLDAQGTIYRSRVTNVTTSELAADSGKPGGYRGPQFGYGIAQVTANTSNPQGATTRTLTVSQTRVERYNRVGVLIDGATNDLAPYTASGIVNRGVLANNSIVGRLVCTNFTTDGNCSSTGSPGNNLTTTGPLFGQDGVRATAGASVALTGNTISQNLVHGAGAPTRGAATNNANLPLGAGVRLVGAAASTASRNNILDNAYGAINVQLDGTTPNTATPFVAENNWWGLRSTGSTLPNAGPVISPASNPAFPENPVNGAGIPDGAGTTSSTVDFFPYRNGAQADPESGQFVVFDAPRPVDDAAPTLSLVSDRAQAYRGETIALTANAGDDFGVRRVTFFLGAVQLAETQAPPYKLMYTVPADAPCDAPRTFTAIVEDSLGQTTSASVSVGIKCYTSTVGGQVSPTLSLTLGAPPSFGSFVPGVAATYNASTTANVLSTAGDATLTVLDPSTLAPGRLVNGSFSLPQAMRARATNPANANTQFAAISGSPLTLLTYPGPISNDGVTLQYQQQIGASDALRTGQYSKTLTYTLSTTTP